MNNQVEPCSFENVHNSSRKLKINSNFSGSIHRLLSPFLNVFLPIIGIQLNLNTVSIYLVMELIDQLTNNVIICFKKRGQSKDGCKSFTAISHFLLC